MKFTPEHSAMSVPRAWGNAVTGRPMVVEVAPVPGSLKIIVILALISLTLLDRFGLRLSDSYSIHPTLFALYGLVAMLLLSRAVKLSASGALLYVGVLTVAGLSFMFNVTLDAHQYASPTSLMLVIVLYAPLILTLKPTTNTSAQWEWVMKWYIGFAVFCAIVGIVQFYAQFVFRAPWLFDYTPFLPPAIRGSGLYNTTNPVGSLIKSNGFFLREASGFSLYMAFALICEWTLKRRKLPMALLVLGVVVSYSGSGLLALAVAMLFPLGQRTLVRVLGAVLLAGIVIVALGDTLNLSYTLGRIGEFNSPKSSAYCRFIAPGKLVADQIDSEWWSVLLGHGPGTTQKMFDVCETTYGKLVFEYGLLGTIAFSALVISAINRSSIPVRIRAVLVLQWFLLGGNLLAPESLLLIFMIAALWPAGVPNAAAAPAGGTRPAAARTRKLEAP